MRTFIAIELTAEIKQELGELEDRLKQSKADVKWVNAEAMHLTLKFLGNITEGEAGEIQKVIGKTAEDLSRFPIAFARIGAFPKLDYPRVIWVGITDGSEQLVKINRALENNLQKLGFAKEKRPFHPHLTLGRLRSPKNKQKLKEIIESSGLGFRLKNQLTASQITLFQSTLTPQGAIYSPLYQALFK